jgi:hypothetical protein
LAPTNGRKGKLTQTLRKEIALNARSHSHDHDHDSEGHCLPQQPHGLLSTYESRGVRFRYPAGWELSEQVAEDEVTVSVQSEGTSFWTIVLLSSRPDPDHVLDSVVETFDQDYDDLDVHMSVGSVCGLPAMGRDLDFVCYDLVNSAVLRAFQTNEKTVFVLFQGTDHELFSTRPELEAISASLEIDEDDLLPG